MSNLTPKSFYTIADFYNFIREPENAPQAKIHNVVQLYPSYDYHPTALVNSSNVRVIQAKTAYAKLFSPNNLAKFSLSVQKLTAPNFSLGSGKTITSPQGHFVTTDNTFLTLDKYNLQIQFLESRDSIIEEMIYPWLNAVLQINPGIDGFGRTIESTDGLSKGFPYPFPRVDMAIKYFKSDQITKKAEDLKDISISFIYFIQGIFPVNIETINISHGQADAGSLVRSVDFLFNNMILLPNKEYASKYRLEHLFNIGNTTNKHTNASRPLWGQKSN